MRATINFLSIMTTHYYNMCTPQLRRHLNYFLITKLINVLATLGINSYTFHLK